jgi:hypothetical protein
MGKFSIMGVWAGEERGGRVGYKLMMDIILVA